MDLTSGNEKVSWERGLFSHEAEFKNSTPGTSLTTEENTFWSWVQLPSKDKKLP